MLHEPAAVAGKDYAIAYKKRVGVWMFAVYAVVYAGFVAVNLLAPAAMEKPVLFGLNLAVAYGFGLILVAFILAVVYNHMCMKEERLSSVSMKERG